MVAGGDLHRLELLAADLKGAGFESRLHLIGDPGGFEPESDLLILDVRTWTAEVFDWCQRTRREEGGEETQVLAVLETYQLEELRLRPGLVDDFIEAPYSLDGLAARMNLARWRRGKAPNAALRAGELVLQPHSYQVRLRGRALELTYMEFELLKFLMTHPGKVFNREALLKQVWRYESYGGYRTVDVHIRRLRAKLGHEHALLIETVRGVGYRFQAADFTRR